MRVISSHRIAIRLLSNGNSRFAQSEVIGAERADQFLSQLNAAAFRIERDLESKDVHKANFQEMEQVGMKMATLIAHVEGGPHPNIQCVLNLNPADAAQYANIPDDTALYLIKVIKNKLYHRK